MNEPQRWSRFKYRGRDQPRGSLEALERAKRELQPFTSEHEPRLQTLCRCEKCVEQNIIEIATEFNARKLVIDGAPRKKTMAENIRRARDGLLYCAETLVALDDQSRHDLLIPSRYPGYDDPILRRAYEAGQAMHLPRPETKREPASDGPLVERLRALGDYFDQRLELLTGWEEEGRVIDKGGNTNVMKEKFGPLGWYIVRNCWVVFENCRPGEATASENGAFLRFVNCVHEYATDEIEENSTLLSWLKKLARPLRHHDNLLKKLGPLEVELDDLKLDPQTPERDARIAQLEAELPALREQVCNALLATGYWNFGAKS